MSNSNDKILKALEDLQAGQQALQADISGLKSDVSTIKNVQQNQGKRLETVEAGQKTLEAGQVVLQADVKGLHGKVDTVELKVEAIHAYQTQAHNEIMGHLIESNEMAGKDLQKVAEQVEQIKKHVGLPPLK